MVAKFLIYGLVDPTSGCLRYIGKSCSGLKRAKAHGFSCLLSGDETHKGRWLKQLKTQGLNYGVVVIQELYEPDILAQAERFWIAYFKQMGCQLTNLTDGGEGLLGYRHSDVTKAKISDANKGKSCSAETRKRLSDVARIDLPKIMAGHREYWTEERRAEQTQAMKELAQKPSHRQKLLNLLSLSRSTPENIEKHRINTIRALATQSAQQNMSTAQTRRFASTESRAQASKAKGGGPILDQHGNVYPSIGSAAKQLNLSRANITAVLKGKRTHTGGYRFFYEPPKFLK